MHPTKKTAHIAGAIYLSLVVTAPFALIYVPGALIVRGDPAATARNILASEQLFRLGIVAELTSAVQTLFLVVALYHLFSGVSKLQSSLLVILGALVSTPITFLNTVHNIAALILLRGPEFLSAFQKPQLDALAMLFIRLHGQGIVVNEIFWGLWLFPFGILVIRSGFLPRILGFLLLINGLAYVILSLTSLLAPDYSPLLNRYALLPETGELWIMLWLLLRGAKVPPAPMTPVSEPPSA